LLYDPLRFAAGVDARDVFEVVPQQVGGDAAGFLDALRNEVAPADFLLAFRAAGVAELDQLAVGGDLEDEGDFLFLEAVGGQALGRVGAAHLRW
jgi:hypothetical protein